MEEYLVTLTNLASVQPVAVGEALSQPNDTPLEECANLISPVSNHMVQEDESSTAVLVRLSRAGRDRAYVVRGTQLLGCVRISDILSRLMGGKP
jgi:hypothetical protein